MEPLTLLTYPLRLITNYRLEVNPHGVDGAGCAHHMLLPQADLRVWADIRDQIL
jgi:hypothetical protein